MKKIFIFLMAFLCFAIESKSQICPNEANLSNTFVCGLYGDDVGISYWDWELDNPTDPNYCKNWYARTSSNFYLTAMGSPFVNPGTGKLKLITESEDYKKQKGWELLQRKFGCISAIQNPYFVLYNKFSGVMRVYVYMTVGSGTYSRIMMKVKSVSQTRPSTLAQANDLMLAPDKYLNNLVPSNNDEVLVSITDAVGNSNWSVGEFNTTLDPNILNAQYSNSSLEITVYGVTNSTLTAEITGQTVSSPNAEDLKDGMFIKKNAPTGSAPFNFTATGEKVTKFSKEITTFIFGINKSSGAIASKLYSSSFYPPNQEFRSFKKKLYEAASATNITTSTSGSFKATVNKLTGFLGNAGKILSYAGKVVGMFENKSNSPAPTPMFTNYNLELKGNITSEVVISQFVLKIPGTTAMGTNNNNATYYLCNLGIFNLKTTPKVETFEYDRRAFLPGYNNPRSLVKTIKYNAYRIKEDVQVVVNKGAGLELVSVEGALAAKVQLPLNTIKASVPITLNPMERHPVRNNYTYFNHMYADLLANRLEIVNYDVSEDANLGNNEYHTIQTKYYDLKCIRNASFNITKSSLKPFLRIRALLRKINDPSGELIYFINDYELDDVQDLITPNNSDLITDLSTNVDALPPYSNYTISPNTSSAINLYSPSVIAIADDYVPRPQNPNTLYNVINQSNEYRYNHSISTPNNYYTLIQNPTYTGLVTFRAGAFIELNPNFEASYGSAFLATTDFGYSDIPCTTSLDLTQYENPAGFTCYNEFISAQKIPTNEIKEKKSLAYPNPTANEINVVINNNIGKIYKVELINELGICYVVPYNYFKNKIIVKNLSSFVQGVYFLKITGENKIVTNKVQIIK